MTKLDEAQKGACLHKWPLLPSAGPSCSEDVIRVMKSLRPVLNTSLHVKKAATVKNAKGGLQVQGPLTWRQFHHMAGVVTKVRKELAEFVTSLVPVTVKIEQLDT